ncbi:MAG TPA: sulfide/dihydroorotate dehydrogenase-like FAD/NAD-binding protein [Clostridiaceae bacterium]|nr:sulfide/dihydroorotate dehydrogenase-like FAD/NAD-binding protein [Clostridiaceae bacterium]
MYKIVRKEVLNPSVKLMEVEAPHVARKAEPGQFIILRIYEDGERIPLTIADFDREKGTVTIIFQEVGKTTKLLGTLEEGQEILDFVGPLGQASHLESYKKVAVIGGGLGTAIAYPQAKKLHSMGAEVHSILGFRNKELIILEKEMAAVSTKLFVTTDDGSNGTKGFVSDVLKKLLEEGNKYDLVIAIGPLIMMKVVSNLTKQYGIKTIVSMNPVMIDGTGMCGGCRITVGGKTKFACVDGPDFDGHEVDFDEAMRRQLMYKAEEKISDEAHECRIYGSAGGGNNA